MVEIYESKPEGFNPEMHVAACYIEVEGKLLFMQRASHKPEGNTWEVPGGKFELNENPEQCAIRELSEETGICTDLSKLRFIGVLYIRKPDFDFTFHLFQIKLDAKPDVCLSQEHQNYRWATPSEMEKENLISGEPTVLKYYQLCSQ